MFCDRKSYSVLSISRTEAGSRKDVYAAVRRMYPSGADTERMEILGNGEGYICVVHDKPRGREKTPTLYAASKARGYTGSTLFVQKDSLDFCEFEKGVLKESRYVENCVETLSRFSAGCGIVFVPSWFKDRIHAKPGARIFRYPGDSNAEIRSALIKISLATLCVVIVALFLLRISHGAKIRAETAEAERKAAVAEVEEEKRKNILADEAFRLRDEYERKVSEIPWDPYTLMSLVSDCIGSTAKLKSVALTGNDFSAELEGSDFSATLLNFERSGEFASCRVKRMNGDRGGEFALNGKACSKRPSFEDGSLDDGERIALYEKLLSDMEKGPSFRGSLSEAFRLIVGRASGSGCETELIQTSESGGVRIEASFSGSRAGVMRLLESLCSEFDVGDTSVSVREGGRLGMVCRIDTGIQVAEKNGVADGQRLPPEKVAESFKARSARTVAAKGGVSERCKDFSVSSMNSTPAGKKAGNVKNGGLVFLGRGESEGRRIVFVKDRNSGRVMKCPNYTEKGGSIEVELDGDIYEVSM